MNRTTDGRAGDRKSKTPVHTGRHALQDINKSRRGAGGLRGVVGENRRKSHIAIDMSLGRRVGSRKRTECKILDEEKQRQ